MYRDEVGIGIGHGERKRLFILGFTIVRWFTEVLGSTGAVQPNGRTYHILVAPLGLCWLISPGKQSVGRDMNLDTYLWELSVPTRFF